MLILFVWQKIAIATGDNLNLHIKDSFMVRDVNHIRELVIAYYHAGKLGKSRSVQSYVVEWHVHNVLFFMGLFKSHTADVDLNDDESKFRRFIYRLIWCLSTKHEKDLCENYQTYLKKLV